MHFRAYGKTTVLSKRHRDAEGNPGPLEVEDVIAGEAKVSRVVFYDGPKETETVVGSVDVGKSGKIEASLPE
jgi:hypothetical protein